jgi:hypothetical protein
MTLKNIHHHHYNDDTHNHFQHYNRFSVSKNVEIATSSSNCCDKEENEPKSEIKWNTTMITDDRIYSHDDGTSRSRTRTKSSKKLNHSAVLCFFLL